jgi:predicted ATPase/class 3 adenylate cyclase
MRELPSGTLTLLFTDIEGSTPLIQQLGARYAELLAAHRDLLRRAFAAHGGVEVDTQGDSFFVAFARATDAVAAAIEAQRALAAYPWPEGGTIRVRMGLHTGEPDRTAEGYTGVDVVRGARIAASGHGGQILLSLSTLDLIRHQLPEQARIRDLGSHRLKGLPQPEPIVQLVLDGLPSDFPPLNSPESAPHNLPVQLTSFVGREREVAAVAAFLRRDNLRLVTLTGPGGSGKTRLALAVAAGVLPEFPDGVWFVSLAGISDPRLVAATIAQIFSLREASGQRVIDTLTAFLRDRKLLLVLDNFEQIIAAAPLVAELLEHAPGIRLLVTSRIVLRLSGEQHYTVPPLSLPGPALLPELKKLAEIEAVRLFVERAALAQNGFELTSVNASAVAAICRRLEGLPLAIELAAARVRFFAPPALLARLDARMKPLTGGARDLPARQRSLHAAIEWSYDLLDEAERTLFRRLAVFVGGCSLEAAETVCGADVILDLDVLDVLAALVDNSLLNQVDGPGAEPRFGMLEMLREYAQEQLIVAGEEATIRGRHAAWLGEYAQRLVPQFFGPQQAAVITQFEVEVENLRGALAWSLSSDEACAAAVRIVTALGTRFWEVSGRLAEGRRWHEAALAHADAGSPKERLTILRNASHLAMQQDDAERAVTLTTEALALARVAGEPVGEASSLNNLGNALRARGDLAGSREAHESARTILGPLDRPIDMAVTLLNLALTAVELDEWSDARPLLDVAVALHRQAGNAFGIANGSLHLSQVTLHLGDLAAARAALAEALTVARELQSPYFLARALRQAAVLAWSDGAFVEAAVLFGACAAPLAEQGTAQDTPGFEVLRLRAREESRQALGARDYEKLWSAGARLTLPAATQRAAMLVRGASIAGGAP